MTTTVRPGRYDPENPYALDAVPPRHSALIGATSALRPARSRAFPLETVLIILGGMCLPTGVIAILIGWYGAAHTGKLYEQNSYLISGGIFGLALVFIGGFLYFGYWMTRQIHVTSAAHQQTLRALGRLEGQLVAVAASSATTAAATVGSNGDNHDYAVRPPRPAPATRTGPKAANATVQQPLVATEHGSLLHRPSCPIVTNKHNLRSVDPNDPTLRPCQICTPLDD